MVTPPPPTVFDPILLYLILIRQYMCKLDRVGLGVTFVTFSTNYMGRRSEKYEVTCRTMGKMKRTRNMTFQRQKEGQRKLKLPTT